MDNKDGNFDGDKTPHIHGNQMGAEGEGQGNWSCYSRSRHRMNVDDVLMNTADTDSAGEMATNTPLPWAQRDVLLWCGEGWRMPDDGGCW